MEILMAIATEQDLENPKMGSERQCRGYVEALAERGHTVHLVNVLKDAPDWSIPYDVCHLVNASGLKGAYMLTADVARMKGIPVLISPVYWPTEEVQDEIISADLGRDPKAIVEGFSVHLNGTAKMMTYADWLLPNAEIEMEKVTELINGRMYGKFVDDEVSDEVRGYSIVHNGVDVDGEIALALQDENPTFGDDFEKLLHKRFILCVARVEPRKNQLNLIKAVDILCEDDSDLQVVMMGMRSAPYLEYIKEQECGRNVLYCPPGPRGAVLRMMLRSSVHAMPSYIETPGLSNMEAAALNKPIVVGDRGSVREYFQDLPGVFYCDPKDVDDMAYKLKQALDFGPAYELGEFIRNTYSYTQIAHKLEMVYKKVIADKTN